MTDSLKEKIENVLQDEQVVTRIINGEYGRRSLQNDYGYSKYYSQKIVKEIRENPNVSVEQKKVLSGSSENDEKVLGGESENSDKNEPIDPEERATNPIHPDDWELPDEWVYDKNYVYNEDDDKYVFSTREFGNIVRTGSWVKRLVRAYSDWDGDADTINEICRGFGITRGLFMAIRRILGLTHDHEPFTPEEIKNKSPEEMAQEAFQMKRFETKQEFDKLDWKATQKEAKKWRNIKHSIIDELKGEVPEIEINPISPDSAHPTDVKDVVLYTGDWHLGAEAIGLPNLPDFNSKVLKNYINYMVKAVRHDFPDARIHLKYTGDAVETVTGMNHADSWKSIEKGYYGAKPILEAEKYLLHLCKSAQISSFQGVTGNHGRITSNRRKDHSGEAELIIYEHLKQSMTDVAVEYSEFSVTDVIDGIGYVTYHGHKKVSKNTERNALTAYQRKFKEPVDFIIVAQGHIHHRKIQEDNQLVRHITVPSLFTGHDYNERNGYGALAGFTVAYRHPVTQAIQIQDYSL